MAEPAFTLYREALGFAPPARPAGRWRAALGACLRAAGGLLYPAHCMACGEPQRDGNGALCETCARRVPWIGSDRCRRCGAGVGAGRGLVESCPECRDRPPVFVEQSCAVAQYDEPLRAVILGLKFGNGVQAIPVLARLLAARMRAVALLEGLAAPAALVPVPLYTADRARRGFNQAEEIARRAGFVAGLPVEPRLLRKIRRTRPQALLRAEERAENLRGSFAVPPAVARPFGTGSVVLVDDVMTTGATVSECARTLHQAGIRQIRVAVLARD